jgi:hypothetical protein
MERAICYDPRQPIVADDHRPIGEPGGDKLPRQLVGGAMPRSRCVGAAFDRRLGYPDASRVRVAAISTSVSGSPHPTMSNAFPFNDTTSTDPVTGRSDGFLERLAARRRGPKIFFTNSSTEYWRGDASLIHTDTDGRRDVSLASAEAGLRDYEARCHYRVNFVIGQSPRIRTVA